MRTYNRPIKVKTTKGSRITEPKADRAPVPQPVEISHTAAALPASASVRSFIEQALHYQTDRWQRSVLFLDMLRERANNMLAHEEAGMPPPLDFEYETILDARRFERPVNYALLRITRCHEDRAEDCVDDKKPPVILIDPRAGHGPGIGGFKRDSEVGMALHEGHATYFVIFFPLPSPNQTLADVLHALRRFVEEVASRHHGQAPVLYGNCQAGWAVMLLSADCEGLSDLDALKPGLYEMKVSNPSGGPDCRKPQYTVRFEERQVEQIQYAYPEQSFERVQLMSEWNEFLYKNTISPWITAFANPISAEMLKWLHPMRISHKIFSEKRNPWMLPVKTLAPIVGHTRLPVDESNQFVAIERAASASISHALESYRKARDTAGEQLFSTLYGSENP